MYGGVKFFFRYWEAEKKDIPKARVTVSRDTESRRYSLRYKIFFWPAMLRKRGGSAYKIVKIVTYFSAYDHSCLLVLLSAPVVLEAFRAEQYRRGIPGRAAPDERIRDARECTDERRWKEKPRCFGNSSCCMECTEARPIAISPGASARGETRLNSPETAPRKFIILFFESHETCLAWIRSFFICFSQSSRDPPKLLN